MYYCGAWVAVIVVAIRILPNNLVSYLWNPLAPVAQGIEQPPPKR